MPRKPKEPTSLQRARKAHADRMRAAGFKAKTFWLSKDASEALERLKGEPNFALDGKPNEGAAINAAILAAAAMVAVRAARIIDDAKAAQKPLEVDKLVDVVTARHPKVLDVLHASEKAEGRRDTSKPPKTPAKPPKGSSDAPAPTVGRSRVKVDLPVAAGRLVDPAKRGSRK